MSGMRFCPVGACDDRIPGPADETRNPMKLPRPSLSSRRLIEAAGKGYVPPDRWTPSTFVEHGAAMIRTLSTTAKVVQRSAQPTIRRVMAAAIEKQGEEVIRFATHDGMRSMKAIDANRWAAALNEVFSRTRPEIVAEVVPVLQSVADQGASKTDSILGNPRPENPSTLIPRVRPIAERIVGIDETTRRRIRKIILDAVIDDGATAAEVARRIREEVGGGWTAARIATIARTETSNAWTLGSIVAMRATPNLISVDVIGCESREYEAWDKPWYQQFMWQGESTCNIEGVSITDAHLLNFHPNHTGVMVPSEFRDASGNVSRAR